VINMSEAIEKKTENASNLGRLLVLIYGVISYFLGVIGLVAIIALASGLIPLGYLFSTDAVSPVVINFVLVAIWGLVHSYMARDSFKVALTRFIPEPAERPTYILMAGITSVLMVGLWSGRLKTQS
jgi:flagellar biosynthesis protein FlhB